MNLLDNYFGLNAQSVLLRSQRAELLASNIINADTPNYKARDIDFKEIFTQTKDHHSIKPVSVGATHESHIPLNGANNYSLHTKYRIPEQSSLDGNTVDSHIEKSNFAENAVRYQISLSFLDNKIQGLISTLKGD